MGGSWAGGAPTCCPKASCAPVHIRLPSGQCFWYLNARPLVGGVVSPPAPMISSGTPPTTPLFGGMGEVDGGTSRVSCPGETDTSHPLSQAPRGSLMTFCVNSAAQPTAPPHPQPHQQTVMLQGSSLGAPCPPAPIQGRMDPLQGLPCPTGASLHDQQLRKLDAPC